MDLSGQHDSDGNRILLTGDQGYYAPFSYDGLGRMSAYADLVRFGYDSAGRRSGLTMGPGSATSSVGYVYDPPGRLQTLAHDLGGTGADQTLGFTYNPASQIVSRSGTNDAYASNTAYNVVRPYSVNGLNQYTSAGPASFAYDANGNLTNDGSTAFVYDAENRLVSASGAKTAALAYDPLGRLWQVTGGGSTTRFLYDGDRLVMELNGSSAVTRSYVHGPGTDEPLVWYDSASGWARRFLHADHQGSIVVLNDDSGNMVAINAYDPWGIPNAGNAGRFGYTGQTGIPELGLWYYKARFYSPTLGRFLQVDPVGYDDQINLYAYVGNDPVNKVDPTGTSEEYSCAKLGIGCGPQNGNSTFENGLRGLASFPRDLFIEIRHAVRLTGLTGTESQNRALLVNEMSERALSYIGNHLGETARTLVDWGLSNKAFLSGRAVAGSIVTAGGGGAVGGAVTVASLTGGGVRALNNVAGQLENGGIDARSFSNRSLGSIMAAGIAGAGVRFDARSGNVVVRTGETGRLAPRTTVICNVRKDC